MMMMIRPWPVRDSEEDDGTSNDQEGSRDIANQSLDFSVVNEGPSCQDRAASFVLNSALEGRASGVTVSPRQSRWFMISWNSARVLKNWTPVLKAGKNKK
jgi:hypothetical protein